MKYEEEEGKQDVAYWVEYFGRFGTSHLSAPAHKLRFWQKHDLDIKGMIGITIFGLSFGLWLVIDTCCLKKKEEE